MTATKPYIYEGTGSAIDDYNSPRQQLQNIVSGKQGNWAIFDKKNPKHKVILSLLYQANWTTQRPGYGNIPDLERLSNFLKSEKSPVSKELKKMTPEETEKVIAALSGIVKSRYK